MSSENRPRNAGNPVGAESATGSTSRTPSKNASANPPFSILHLLVWTAGSAAMMALLRLPYKSDSVPIHVIYLVGCALYGGTVLGGVLLWIARRWRGGRFPVEPGEWLLAVQGISVVWFIVLSHLEPRFYRSSQEYRLFCLLAVSIGLLPVINCRAGRVWRVFVVALAGLYATPLITLLPSEDFRPVNWFVWAALVLIVLSTLLLLAAAALDIRSRVRRGWVHWVGVIALLSFVFGQTAYLIWLARFSDIRITIH